MWTRYIIPGVVILLWVAVIVRFLRNSFGRIRTVEAVVVDKHKPEGFSQYAGSGRKNRHVVVFEFEGKRKGFYVSEFSYDGYRLKERGTLTYRGERLLGFE